MIRSFKDKRPRIGAGAYVDPSAQVIGDVELGAGTSVWPNAVVRGDVHRVRIGAHTNLQDLCVAHVTHDTHPLLVGDQVTVGHHAVIHGCTIAAHVLVGIGARVLDGAEIAEDVIVGAGCLVTPGTRIPRGSLVIGLPGRVTRTLSDGERDHIRALAARYAALAEVYASQDEVPG